VAFPLGWDCRAWFECVDPSDFGQQEVAMAEAKYIAAICERLLEVVSPTSLRIRLEILQSNETDHGRYPDFPLKQEWASTSAGLRYFDTWYMPPTEPFIHRSVYSDGHRFAHVWYQQDAPARQAQVSIDKYELVEKRDFFLDAPWPIRATHVGIVPLHEALPTAEVLQDGDVIGRGCDVFHFKNAGLPSRPQSLVSFLDKATSFPLKIAAYKNPDHIRDQKPNWVWEATTFDRVSGKHFLPLSSIYSSYFYSGGLNSEPKLDLFQSIRIVSAEFDTAIPAGTFWPVVEQGVSVSDATKPLHTAVRDAPSTTSQTSRTGDPIRAEEPQVNSALLTATGLGLSLTVILIAVVLWKRSR